MGNKLPRLGKGQATFVGDITLNASIGDARVAKGSGKNEKKAGTSPKKGVSMSAAHDGYFSASERKKFEGSCKLSKPKFQDPIHWKRGELLGSGAFGRVFLGLHTRTGELMAVKQITLTHQGEESDECLRALENEIKLMRRLDHKSIVRYWGTERTDKTFSIFMEFIPGGSISTLLKKFGRFNETLVRVYTKQILEGLHYLHSHRIMHRDIKGANILVDRGGICKLSDFGAAKHLSELTSATNGFSSLRGTPYWMAPEVVRQTGAGRQADIWSVGCTVIEMATGKPPFSNFETPVSALFHIAVAPGPPEFPACLSDTAHDFLRLCFMKNPADRPNAVTLLQHPFICAKFLSAPSMHNLPLDAETQDIIPPGVFDDEESIAGAAAAAAAGSWGEDSDAEPVSHSSRRTGTSISSTASHGSRRGKPVVRAVFPFGASSASPHDSVKSSSGGGRQRARGGSAKLRGTYSDGAGGEQQQQQQPQHSQSERHSRSRRAKVGVISTKQRLVFNGATPSASSPGKGSESPFIWRKASNATDTQPSPRSATSGGVSVGGNSVAGTNSHTGGSTHTMSSAEVSINSELSGRSFQRSDSRKEFSDADWHRTVGEANSSAYESYRSYVEDGANPYGKRGSLLHTPRSPAARDALESELQRQQYRTPPPHAYPHRSSNGNSRSTPPGSRGSRGDGGGGYPPPHRSSLRGRGVHRRHDSGPVVGGIWDSEERSRSRSRSPPAVGRRRHTTQQQRGYYEDYDGRDGGGGRYYDDYDAAGAGGWRRSGGGYTHVRERASLDELEREFDRERGFMVPRDDREAYMAFLRDREQRDRERSYRSAEPAYSRQQPPPFHRGDSLGAVSEGRGSGNDRRMARLRGGRGSGTVVPVAAAAAAGAGEGGSSSSPFSSNPYSSGAGSGPPRSTTPSHVLSAGSGKSTWEADLARASQVAVNLLPPTPVVPR